MRLVLLAAATLLIATQANGQAMTPPPARQAKGFQTIQADAIRRDLTYVASDAMEGRLSLTPGDEKAIAWIADQFAKAGLKPAAVGADGKPSYLQPIRMVEYRNDPAASSTTLTRGGKATIWHAPDVAGGFRDDVALSAPVVFAGFGITAPELGYDDYAGLDARGKIVLIFDHEPQEADAHSIFNGLGLTRYATARVKVLNAQKHGAVAVLIVPEPNRKHFTNAQRGQAMGQAVTPRYAPLASQAIENDEVKIPSLTLREPIAAELMATSGMTPSQVQSAIDEAAKPHSMALPDASLAIRLRNASRRLGVTSNVVALLPGSDPKLASETILISGHHDHDGMEACADPANPPVTVPADPTPCPRIWKGADDNGSGTVGVVTLARAFAANPVKPKRSILFAVFASEERGLLGSYYLAAHPLRPLASTKAMINFDMIGRDEIPSPQTDGVIDIPADTTNRLNLIGALYSPDYDRIVKDTNKAVGLTLDDRFDRDSALNVFFRSDQFPFVLHDIPAFWWFTGFHPDYHHTTDTVDKIDFPKMEKILKLAYLTAWRFGEEATTPRFVANPKVN
jgi:hypothetical protein